MGWCFGLYLTVWDKLKGIQSRTVLNIALGIVYEWFS
jgi:hypothetical protein